MVANLNGNPAHLAMLCNNRQQPFEVDLTGSTLTFQVRSCACIGNLRTSFPALSMTSASSSNQACGHKLGWQDSTPGRQGRLHALSVTGRLADASSPAAQNVDYGGIYISGCANLNLHGPATLTYATAALGFTQVMCAWCGVTATASSGMRLKLPPPGRE